mmetsp:Transcript_17781/g.54375  ORF Transcript_17781/g.54375 Transcript_17781/m.54375 type:complete len:937 (-) Transcript_17781:464-3274(-)
MASFIRDSKFRHVVPSLSPRDQWYENLKVSDRGVATSLLACSHHFLAHAHGSANGNSVCVLPLTSTGKNHVPVDATAYQVPLIRAGTGKVTAVAFDPFRETRVVTASEDGVIKVWDIPEKGLSADSNAFTAVLHAASEGALEFLAPHLSAANILASATTKAVEIWDYESSETMLRFSDPFSSTEIQCIDWSYLGDQLLTASKDKMLRIIDARSGDVAAETEAHGNGRDTKALFAGNSYYLVSAGFKMSRNRELALWDSRSLGEPVKRKRLDANTGPLFPIYDPDTGILAVTGRGDTSLKTFELSGGDLHELAACGVGAQVHGVALLPKIANDILGNEVLRILKLTADSVEPLSVTVPRRHARQFEQDLFPPTFAGSAVLSAQDWLGGQDQAPDLMAISNPRVSLARHSSVNEEDLKAAIDAAEIEEKGAAEGEPPTHKRWASTLANKFKHLRGAEADLHRTWFNMRPNASSPDGDLLAVSDKFFATPYQGAGGAVMVRPLAVTGKVLETSALLAGHRAPVVSLAFSPFNDHLLATGSDDCDIRLWQIPDDGLTESWDGSHSLLTLSGHSNGVRTLDFHPLAENLLVSTSPDNTLAVWDVDNVAQAGTTTMTPNASAGAGCFNLSFDYTGDMAAAFCRDRFLRTFDLRSMSKAAEVQAHEGAKGGRVAWCSRDATSVDVIATTGWDRRSKRELKVWDPRNLAQPLSLTVLEAGSGALSPLWDEGTGVLFLCGRGEATISPFELAPHSKEEADGSVTLTGMDVFRCSGFMSRSDPQICCAPLPKQRCDVKELEFYKLLRLTVRAVEPVSFLLPRAAKLKSFFNDDIFPPTRRREAALSASDWLQGDAAEVPLESLRPEGMPLLSEKPMEHRVSNSKILMAKVNAERETQRRTSQEFGRMQQLALQYAKYNPNESMGRRKGVDMESNNDGDEVSDSEWD